MDNYTDPIHDAGVVERFFAKAAPPNADGCMLWLAARYSNGYGAFKVGGTMRGAHAVALEIATGEAASGRHALHSCDRPSCVAACHLRWGDHSENMRDAVERGRHVETRKTHCPAGHEYAGDNLHVNPSGARVCRECRRQRQRTHEYRARLRAQTRPTCG